jgi:hypothetical protein
MMSWKYNKNVCIKFVLSGVTREKIKAMSGFLHGHMEDCYGLQEKISISQVPPMRLFAAKRASPLPFFDAIG